MKFKLLATAMLAATILIGCTTQNNNNTTLIPAGLGDKCGYIDETGNLVTA